MEFLDIQRLEIDVEEKKDSVWNSFEEKQNHIRFLHYRKIYSEIPGLFGVPSGVNPFHVSATEIRKLSAGDRKLVFIWPQKYSNRGQISKLLVPVIRAFLIGLITLDILHFWPGEFMPRSLPSTLPPRLPPVKCNVIEPRWSDNSS